MVHVKKICMLHYRLKDGKTLKDGLYFFQSLCYKSGLQERQKKGYPLSQIWC